MFDGEGEVVGGIVIMEQERNALAVAQTLKNTLSKVRSTLPDGIEIATTYDRSSLIWEALQNFIRALGYDLIVVMFVIIWALRSGCNAVAPVAVLLLRYLFTVLPLAALGQTTKSAISGRACDCNRQDGGRNNYHR